MIKRSGSVCSIIRKYSVKSSTVAANEYSFSPKTAAKKTAATLTFAKDTFATFNCQGPPAAMEVSRDTLLKQLRQMLLIRRTEMAADALYKERAIRGFCHLSIGQEAVAVGIESVLRPSDCVITAYRCHGFALMRGTTTVRQVIGELLGRKGGISDGKGGSMHMFAERFYGGNGIVGAQVPVGTGIALAQQYYYQVVGKNKKPSSDGNSNSNSDNNKNCNAKRPDAMTFALYGDGAANQGQVFESFNMAALWKLPIVFVCENNRYGMGTSAERSSASTDYYRRAGDMIPGVRANGMDVVAVQTAAEYCRQHCLCNGPIILELLTYRYHGHSMSDPGSTYRTREEIQKVRSEQDPIKTLRAQLSHLKWLDEAGAKEVEENVKKEVEEQSMLARSDPLPDDSDLWTHVYSEAEPKDTLKRGCTEYHKV